MENNSIRNYLGLCLSFYAGILITSLSMVGTCMIQHKLMDKYYALTKKDPTNHFRLITCYLIIPFVGGLGLSFYTMQKLGLIEFHPIL